MQLKAVDGLKRVAIVSDIVDNQLENMCKIDYLMIDCSSQTAPAYPAAVSGRLSRDLFTQCITYNHLQSCI